MTCTSGFIYQSWDICTNYFAFDTITHINIEIPEVIQVPDFSLCIRYYDIFNIDQYINDTGFKYSDDAENSEDFVIRAKELEIAVSIKDIFEYTPYVKDLWLKCLSRRVDDYNIIENNGSRCLGIFSVKKYYIQEFICYKYHQIVSENLFYYYNNIAYSLTYSGSLLWNYF